MKRGLPDREPDDLHRWQVLLTVFTGTFMAPLDSSIVNIALPSLTEHFSVDISSVSWVVMSYLLTTSALLLTAGRLGDMKGHRRTYIAGFFLFTATSIFCGLSSSIGQLVFFRVLQALGGTFILAAGPAIITDAYPASERGKALGIIAVSVAVGLTAGPFLGGLIVAGLGWRWVFFINVPIGIAAISMSILYLRESRTDKGRRFDIAGSLTALLALLAILMAVSFGGKWGWGSLAILGLTAAAIVTSALFLIIEKREKEPMLDLDLFRNRLFSAANASAMINYMALFVLVLLVPFYLRDIFRLSYQKMGLILTAIPLLSGTVSPLSGSLSDRIGSRILSSAGLAITSLALLGLAMTSPEGGLTPVVLMLGMIGLGTGMFQPPNTSSIMGSVPKNRLGTASAMQATMRNTGMVFGVALAGAIVAAVAPGGPADASYLEAIHTAFVAGAAVSAAGVITSLVRGNEVPAG